MDGGIARFVAANGQEIKRHTWRLWVDAQDPYGGSQSLVISHGKLSLDLTSYSMGTAYIDPIGLGGLEDYCFAISVATIAPPTWLVYLSLNAH